MYIKLKYTVMGFIRDLLAFILCFPVVGAYYAGYYFGTWYALDYLADKWWLRLLFFIALSFIAMIVQSIYGAVVTLPFYVGKSPRFVKIIINTLSILAMVACIVDCWIVGHEYGGVPVFTSIIMIAVTWLMVKGTSHVENVFYDR